MPVVDTLLAAAQVVLPQPAPLGGALIEETALITRWLSDPGVRIVCATDGFASPRESAGPWLDWAATARSARYAAEFGSSEVLGKAHPAGEQLLRRAGVDGLGRAGQPLLPRGEPFGVAG